MAVQQLLVITDDINADGRWVGDIGGFDYAIVQLVSPTGAFNFETTNDSNDITGSSDGSAASATNWIGVQGTNLNSGSAVTSLNASGIVRFGYIGRYLRITGGGLTVTKAIVRLFKIN